MKGEVLVHPAAVPVVVFQAELHVPRLGIIGEAQQILGSPRHALLLGDFRVAAACGHAAAGRAHHHGQVHVPLHLIQFSLAGIAVRVGKIRRAGPLREPKPVPVEQPAVCLRRPEVARAGRLVVQLDMVEAELPRLGEDFLQGRRPFIDHRVHVAQRVPGNSRAGHRASSRAGGWCCPSSSR